MIKKDVNIKIYFLPWLIALSFLIRLVVVYFYRDIETGPWFDCLD